MPDKRFDRISKEPKFRQVSKVHNKVKIDKRFQSMFTGKQFQTNYTSDKRGRPVKFSSKNDLKKYYELSSEEDVSNSSEDENEHKCNETPLKQNESGQDGNLSNSDEDPTNTLDTKAKGDKNISVEVKLKLKDLHIDYARGEKALYSESSSDDEETDEEVSETEELDHKWGELDADADRTEEATYRLAACNLDWDRIRAVDIMILLSSFLPSGGVIKSVAIYPSEYGKKRLKEEEVKGPIELVKNNHINKEENESEEGLNFHMEKLRQYQLNRLKYYYAVITFDSPNSANKVYSECDGMEYESSATKIDLRFIPDDMTFDDIPKESCDKMPEKYEPRFFTTTALQQAKVELTWDETNPERLEFAEKLNNGKIDDISQKDLQNFLASSSEEEEEDNSGVESELESFKTGSTIDKYKALLEDIHEKEEEKHSKDLGMEISWGVSLKEKTDKLMKERLEQSEEKSPFQKYLDKRKEKRKEKKMKKTSNKEDSYCDIPSDIDMNDPYFAEEFNNVEFKKGGKQNKKKDLQQVDLEAEHQKQAELDLLLMNEEGADDKKHFSLKKIQENDGDKKGKKKKNKNKKKVQEEISGDNNFKINVEDERFSAIFTSHHYNIDPTDPHYKKTKGMETLIHEKIKRRQDDASAGNQEKIIKLEEKSFEKTKNAELKLLVKNVKRRAHEFKRKN
ncbi:ESF1 homolog [Euwallacea fornicatus]|uniref:ESF1 homolog n=1 Tax=Euwallacea fornicatus TaxID=995702 RepID=UPI0033904AB1